MMVGRGEVLCRSARIIATIPRRAAARLDQPMDFAHGQPLRAHSDRCAGRAALCAGLGSGKRRAGRDGADPAAIAGEAASCVTSASAGQAGFRQSDGAEAGTAAEGRRGGALSGTHPGPAKTPGPLGRKKEPEKKTAVERHRTSGHAKKEARKEKEKEPQHSVAHVAPAPPPVRRPPPRPRYYAGDFPPPPPWYDGVPFAGYYPGPWRRPMMPW